MCNPRPCLRKVCRHFTPSSHFTSSLTLTTRYGFVRSPTVRSRRCLSSNCQSLMRHCICQISVQRWLAEVLQVSDTCLFLSTLPARQWDIQVTPSVVALPFFARVLHKAAASLQVADEQTARNRTQLKVASEAAKSFQSDADLEESIAAIQRSLELVSRLLSHKHHKHHKISGHFSFAGKSSHAGTACTAGNCKRWPLVRTAHSHHFQPVLNGGTAHRRST